ncbi:MAG TPA: helix-turn-helix transcriptional regulator [Flavilitoribacter sp.]|nr:helix-turn-helix transcriptional regulator [Flavilitoribacter sp.]HMQ87069.1 helix-turn-helix transcriptional regulator [Flavilitoribacter sp.]
MSKTKEPTYEDLRKKLSDEEIVESFVFRSSMTDEEREQANDEFRKLRFESLKNMSDEQILQSELMRMRLLMKDYFKQSEFIESYSFSSQLKKYIDLLKKTRTDFAADLDIHKTKLSRILNDKENPNIELMYRLEHHSGNMIPATYWHRLYSRKLEEDIKMDTIKRLEEYKRVKNRLKFKKSA